MMDKSQKDEEPPRKKAKARLERDWAKKDLAALPYDVLVNIFKHLDLRSISLCATLCSTLNNVSKDGSLYRRVTLKYNMNKHFLESYISRITCPVELYIKYKFFDQQTEAEDYTEFTKSVATLLQKCGEYLLSLKIESCRSDDVLLLLSECTNVKTLCLYRCRSSFTTLPTLSSLTNIRFVQCHFPPKIVTQTIANNVNLKKVFLSDNVNVNVNDVCETMAKCNTNMKDIHLSEKKKIRAKSLRSLARLNKLKNLELISGSGFDCDPEDSLEQLAAGCSLLEKLTIYGWREINDENLMPILHTCTKLKKLDLRGVNITIKSCREAALSLPLLKTLDVIKCSRVKKAQLVKLQQDFSDINIPLE